MAGDSLADRRKRVPREFFEHVVQATNRLFREAPRNRRIVARCAPYVIDVEEEGGPCCYRLHENRSRPTDQGRHTEEITGANIAHGDLPAGGRMHIDAKQAAEDDGQLFSVRFGIHGVARREFRDAPALDHRFARRSRQLRPATAAKQTNDAVGRQFTARLDRWTHHRIRLERNVRNDAALPSLADASRLPGPSSSARWSDNRAEDSRSSASRPTTAAATIVR